MRERKYKRPRTPRELFIVFCEGETEKNYVELLKRHFRLPIAIKTKIGGSNINDRFINQCIREIVSTDIKNYRVFYIYDADVQATVEKLNNLKEGKVILSNPCIEIWFLLHNSCLSKSIDAPSAVKLLRDCPNGWKSYKKGCLSSDQENMLLDNMESAIFKAKKLNFPNNPSSNIYEFLDTLKKAQVR